MSSGDNNPINREVNYMHDNIDKIISELTLSEKIDMIHGKALFKNGAVERLNIPPVVMSDGPCGVRFDHRDDAWITKDEDLCYSSWLPSGAAIASTWNPDLAYAAGEVLGEEARGRGKDVILAPGINIHRTPLCGRNFEYMSEDPYLTGVMAASEINGIQSRDIGACVKHFALNNQEKDRMCVDVAVSDRALYEIYLPAFKAATTISNSYTIMCSYNKLRGDYASESKLLMTDILRDEWHYEGLIISDWGAVHSTDECAFNGVDIEMGVDTNFDGYFFADKLEEAVKDGRIPLSVIDERVRRILTLQNILKCKQASRNKGSYNTPEHHNTLLNVAREGIVLLKNDDNILPLNTNSVRRIAVIGDAATRKLAHGGGSSEIKALFEISPLLGINMISGGDIDIFYAPGYYVDNADNTGGEVNWQASSLDKIDDTYSSETKAELCDEAITLLNEAVELARSCDEVIYIGGLNRAYDTEGFDRSSYELPYNQDRVINALLDVNPNTVIYLLSGSAVNMSHFADRAKAILWSSMLGMQGGLALAEVIFGRCNPSGKLPVTFASDIKDYASHSIGEYPGTPDSSGEPHCNYTEDIYVGYRHFTSNNIIPVFDFGHGLSYSDYEYSNLTVTSNSDVFDINVTITNTGNIAGDEVAMLFISPTDSDIARPAIELKGFKKVHLEPGESKIIRLHAEPASFAYYDEAYHSYRATKGSYEIKIGRSVSDIRLHSLVTLTMDYNIESLITGYNIVSKTSDN